MLFAIYFLKKYEKMIWVCSLVIIEKLQQSYKVVPQIQSVQEDFSEKTLRRNSPSTSGSKVDGMTT